MSENSKCLVETSLQNQTPIWQFGGGNSEIIRGNHDIINALYLKKPPSV
jgi:hypothetical protein